MSGQGRGGGPRASHPATKAAVQGREVSVDAFLDQKRRIHPNTFLLLFRCANAGQRETVLPANISEQPRLDHVKQRSIRPKIGKYPIIQLWDQA